MTHVTPLGYLLFIFVWFLCAVDRFMYRFANTPKHKKPRLDAIWPMPLFGEQSLELGHFLRRLTFRDGHLYTVIRESVSDRFSRGSASFYVLTLSIRDEAEADEFLDDERCVAGTCTVRNLRELALLAPKDLYIARVGCIQPYWWFVVQGDELLPLRTALLACKHCDQAYIDHAGSPRMCLFEPTAFVPRRVTRPVYLFDKTKEKFYEIGDESWINS